MDLEGWLSSALDAYDNGKTLLKVKANSQLPKNRKVGCRHRDKPQEKRGKGLSASLSPERVSEPRPGAGVTDERKHKGPTCDGAAAPKGRARQPRKQRDYPDRVHPFKAFREIKIKRQRPTWSSSSEESCVFTDDESLDERLLAGLCPSSAPHLHEGFGYMCAESEDHKGGKGRIGKGKKTKTKKKNEKKGRDADETEFAETSAAQEWRRMKEWEQRRLEGSYACLRMTEKCRLPVWRRGETGEMSDTFEYRFLGVKLQPTLGFYGHPATTRMMRARRQRHSPATRTRKHKQWMKQLLDGMKAAQTQHIEQGGGEQPTPAPPAALSFQDSDSDSFEKDVAGDLNDHDSLL